MYNKLIKYILDTFGWTKVHKNTEIAQVTVPVTINIFLAYGSPKQPNKHVKIMLETIDTEFKCESFELGRKFVKIVFDKSENA